MSNHFTIAIDTCNHQKWIERCLNSCLTQKYDNYEVILVDALSDDNTFEIAKKYATEFSNLKVYQNEIRLPQVANFVWLAKLSKPGTIIVTVDGDDFLKGPKVLQTLDAYYGESNNVWLTYGSYIEWPSNKSVSFHYRSHTLEEIENNQFREAPWMASHLRTYRRELVLKVNESDLKDVDGNWFFTTGDQAITLPCLELAGKHSLFIPDILYYYNTGDQSRDSARNEDKQIELCKYIRSKEKYKPLENL